MRILPLLSQKYIYVCGDIVDVGLLSGFQQTEIGWNRLRAGYIAIIGAVGIDEGLGVFHTEELVNLGTVDDGGYVEVHDRHLVVGATSHKSVLALIIKPIL